MAIIRAYEDVLNDEGINIKTLKSCLDEHKRALERYNLLHSYYNGEQAILNRTKDRANNKVVVNHAEYITDFAVNYFIGNEITFQADDEKTQLMLNSMNTYQTDTELCYDISIFGVGYELVYQNPSGETKSTNIDPRNCFIVVDDTVEYNTICAVHFYTKNKGQEINVYTNDKKLVYFDKGGNWALISEEPNIFGKVPVIEYWNKSNVKGDFESVVSLIDAYNVLQSDRVNDKENFINSLLVVYGMLIGDDIPEKVETAKQLKALGILEMPTDTRVEYITKTFNESDVEILKNSIVQDIHKISKVPNLTDENFAGNSSGVAMRYKLLGLEQLAKTKEGYFRIGLKERFKLYANIQKIKMLDVDINSIKINFTRALPVNELEISQLVNNLKGTVSDETLLAQLPFVSNVEQEIERLNEQKTENVEKFGVFNMQNEKTIEDEE